MPQETIANTQAEQLLMKLTEVCTKQATLEKLISEEVKESKATRQDLATLLERTINFKEGIDTAHESLRVLTTAHNELSQTVAIMKPVVDNFDKLRKKVFNGLIAVTVFFAASTAGILYKFNEPIQIMYDAIVQHKMYEDQNKGGRTDGSGAGSK